MKIVINDCYGGYDLPQEALDFFNIDDCYDIRRDDAKLIEWVENNISECTFNGTLLKIVKIPDEATDYIIEDYDGAEWVTYVIDGKICQQI